MELEFIGADHEVTGSCHYLRVGDRNILVDYGMEQGNDAFENAKLPVDIAVIDYVLLTHAHVDHSGMLPFLYSRGFRGKIYTTVATADLCSIMLRDCAHIQMQEVEWKTRKAKRSSSIHVDEPVYTMEDAIGTIALIVPCEYGQMIDLCDGVRIRFTDVGHLLGSASIEVWAEEEGVSRKLVFSGDIGNKNQPLIKDPSYTEEADYVIMESTYGNRMHPEERVDYVHELADIIQTTFDRGGNVVIPSFAVGRTQEMLYFIRQIKADKLVTGHGEFPVYVDSPLAVEATGIFQKNIDDCFDEEAMKLVEKGINPISFTGLKLAITSDESKLINFDSTPKVIISASGMCEAGRIRHHLKHNLWRGECTILFVGYQAEGTLGRAITEGAREVKLFGEPIEVNAHIMQMQGLSGHADKAGLLEWVSAFKKKPDRVFVVHGSDESATQFTECLKTEHGFEAYAPYSGTRFDLASDRFIYEAQPKPVKKKVSIVSDVFSRLVAAGQRLMAVIQKNQGVANKDLAKFADQINALSDKWDR
jgi:metallo-beta-lactamase family protein